nr:MAG TPA: hypothetical protein [Caudoviricetes sp.]
MSNVNCFFLLFLYFCCQMSTKVLKCKKKRSFHYERKRL